MPRQMDTRSVEELVRFSDEKMQKIPLFDSDRYFFDIYCLKPGQDQRIHSHPESDKIYVVFRGRGMFHIGGEERELCTGEAVVARPGEPHGVLRAIRRSGARDRRL